MGLKTPHWIYEPSVTPQEWIKKGDLIAIDSTSPAVLDTNTLHFQTGVAPTGEADGWAVGNYGIVGIYSVPIIYGVGNTAGPNGTPAGTEYLERCKNDEGEVFATRDVATLFKSGIGPTNQGSISIYSAGYSGYSNFILDATGGHTFNVGTNLTINSSTINLGSPTPGDAAALASKVGANFTNIQSAITTLLSSLPATSNPQTAALVTALEAFCNAISFTDTTSQVVKISS